MRRDGTSGVSTAASLPPRRSRLGALIAGLALLGLGALLAVWWTHRAPFDQSPIDSIAILPFANASNDPAMDYLSDGLTESLINGLSELPQLRVVPRSTAFHYQKSTQEPLAIGAALGVRAVLTGRVVQQADMLVVSVELIDVSRRAELWGHPFESRMAGLATLQSDIVRQVSEKLALRLTGSQSQKLATPSTQNSEAYRLYLKGLYHRQRTTEAGFDESVRDFQQAVDLDPKFPLAYAGLSDSYGSLGYLELRASSDVWPKAKEAAQKAIGLDDTLAEAHAALGHAILRYEWDGPKARAEIERAISLNPRYGIAHHWYAHYFQATRDPTRMLEESRKAVDCEPLDLMLNTHLILIDVSFGDPAHALEEIRKMQDIEPDFWSVHTALGIYHDRTQQFDKAVQEFRKGVELSASMPLALVQSGIAYALRGKRQDAEQVAAELERLPYAPASYIASIYARLNDEERTLFWLQRGYRERDGGMIDINLTYGNWPSNARYQEIMRGVRLELPSASPAGRVP